MSLLAGFDVVVEVSNETILTLIKAQEIENVPLNPPFQIVRTISLEKILGIKGTISTWFIVKDITIDIYSDNSISLNLEFDKSAIFIEGNDLLNREIYPLSGILTIKTPLKLDDGSELYMKTIATKIEEAEVNIEFSKSSNDIIVTKIPFLTPETFAEVANKELTKYVQSMENIKSPIEFKVIPNLEGSLLMPQFERLDFKCVGKKNKKDLVPKDQQALCLLGVILKANSLNGIPEQKTTTAIEHRQDPKEPRHDLCVSISPEAFKSLIFCPKLASMASKIKKENVNITDLPECCGYSNGLDIYGVTLSKLCISFAQGYINIDGAGGKSYGPVDVKFNFHGKANVSIKNSTITSSVYIGRNDVNVDIDIPWYIYPFKLLIPDEEEVKIIAVSVLNSMFSNAKLSYSLNNPIRNLGSLIFDKISITSEGATIQGSIFYYLIAPAPMEHSLSITGSVVSSRKNQVSSGIYHAYFPLCKTRGDYPYTEYTQQQTGTYSISSTLLTPPFDLHWGIKTELDSKAVHLLEGESGTISFPAKSEYLLPLPLGFSVDHIVHINFKKSGNSIKLTNQPSEGNYSFWLYVKCNDAVGNSLEAYTGVFFQGNDIKIGGSFYEDEQACRDFFAKEYWEHIMSRPSVAKVGIKPSDLIGPPRPEMIAKLLIYDLISSNNPGADSILTNMKLANINTYYTGIYSEDASKVGLSKEAKDGISAKARVGVSQEYIQSLLTLINLAKTNEIFK